MAQALGGARHVPHPGHRRRPRHLQAQVLHPRLTCSPTPVGLGCMLDTPLDKRQLTFCRDSSVCKASMFCIPWDGMRLVFLPSSIPSRREPTLRLPLCGTLIASDHRLALISYNPAEVPVNWCPALGTVLANEVVVDGVSERGGYPVTRKVRLVRWRRI